MEYNITISQEMRAVADYLVAAFEGMNHCISSVGSNYIVEVPKHMVDEVKAALKLKFRDVALIKDAYSMIEDLHDFILVKPIISEAPLFEQQGVVIPNLEKLLVDRQSDKEFASLSDSDLQREFQRAFELYDINKSRLLRYAGRKGKKEEIQGRLGRIDSKRVHIIHTIQESLSHEPIERAWLFGSFSRMEETPASDIDILVDLDPDAKIGLMYYAGIINRLENSLGRKVDLVANGSVKPFALDSINRDKILIYERTEA